MISRIYTHVITRPHRRYRRAIQMISHIYTHVITRPHRQYRRAIQMISHICTNVVTQPYKQHTLHALQTSLCSQTNIPTNTTEPYGHHGTTQTTLCSHHRAIQTSMSHTNNITQKCKLRAIQTSLSHTNNITQKCKLRAIQTSLSHTNNITQKCKRQSHTNTTDFRSIYVSKCSASIQIPHIQTVSIHLNLILLRIQLAWWKGSLERWWTELSVHSIPTRTCNK